MPSERQQNEIGWMADIMSWLPRIYGTDIGTGSGLKLTEKLLRRTGQVFTGYELLECLAVRLAPQPISIAELLGELTYDIEGGKLIMLEHPTPNNQLGKYRFDPTHPFNINNSKEEFSAPSK
ncbi:hypothetical protein N431DRAFT_468859 [Stipitochalara longipes BDJ]|nr:hypothetical protein N431DRAFT_468859 [Stipitochalara longipes BDJ]